MHEAQSPLKYVFCIIILQNVLSQRNDFVTLFYASMLKSQKKKTFSEKIFVFSGLDPCKLMQQPFFIFSKGIICILNGILKSLSLLEGMHDLANTIKPPIQYIWTDYTDIQTDYWEKVRYAQNINIFIDHFI